MNETLLTHEQLSVNSRQEKTQTGNTKLSSSLEQQFLLPSRGSKILNTVKVEIDRLLRSLVTEQQGIGSEFQSSPGLLWV